MSVEIIASQLTSSEVQEDSEPQEQTIETVEDRRIRLSKDLADITLRLGKLYENSRKLTEGLCGLIEAVKNGAPDATINTHANMMAELDELNVDIAEQRVKQGKLITEIAFCNTTIIRPRPSKDPSDNSWREPRRAIEVPYVNAIQNSGEDPNDLAQAPAEMVGVNNRYVTNAVI